MVRRKDTFTEQQRAAINTRNVSIALSAGAGCGKTFVLTERFLSHLNTSEDDLPLFKDSQETDTAPARLHEIVAITFTDRAAREMRDRIRAKCYERLRSAPADEVSHWLKLLRSLDAARISTIHAFCANLLRSHAAEAQLDPQFVVAEQAQADTLLAEIAEDVLREKLSEQDADFIDLATHFGIDRLQTMLVKLSEQRTIDFDAWCGRTPEDVVAIWAQFHADKVVPVALRELAVSPATLRLFRVLREMRDVPSALSDSRDLLLFCIPTIETAKPPAALIAELREAAKMPRGGRNIWQYEEEQEAFKSAAEGFRRAVDKILPLLTFDARAAIPDAVAGLQLLRALRIVLDRYQQRKRDLGWLDFNDLLVKAHALLVDPRHETLQRRLVDQVRMLLVDESQDTDPVQVEIIKALCGDEITRGKLFFVGDYKQSIYHFRGADPTIFSQLQQDTPIAGRLSLTTNFRSQPEILDFVNALFCDSLSNQAQPAAETTSTLSYEHLTPARPQVVPKPCTEFLWAVLEDAKKSDSGARDEARKKEAEFIARRIQLMLANEDRVVAEKEDGMWTARRATQNDIAILFRSLSDVRFYEEALRRNGIDYYLVGGHAFYAQQEIYDVLNLLRTLISPADEISLTGALRSPFFSLSDEALFWLCQHPHGLAGGLFADEMPRELAADDRERVLSAVKVLRQLRACKDRLPIAALINEALRLTGYDAALLAEFLGDRKLANLQKLLDQARSFDQSGRLSLSDFIVQLAEFVVHQPREPLAATHPEGANVVRLMTIHQSKGLEFPIVFVPDICRATFSDEFGAAWRDTLGPLVRTPSPPGSAKFITGLDLHNAIVNAAEREERIRLLYVATTRAADFLVLSAGTFEDELEKPTAPWISLLAERFDLKTGACTATLPDDCTRPSVKVVTDVPKPKLSADRNDNTRLGRSIEQALALAKQRKGTNRFDSLVAPTPIDHSAQIRFSISRLNGLVMPELQSDTDTNDAIDFTTDSLAPESAAELGTLVHRVLSRIKFIASSEVETLAQRTAEAMGSHAEQHVDAATQLICAFLNSPRARKIAASNAFHRELEFLLKWPPIDHSHDRKQSRDQLLHLHGFIDCLYQDNSGNWRLLDFKTNRVPAEDVASAAAQYELQLGVYALAVEGILGKTPAELTLCFLHAKAEHEFVWNAEMRARTIDRVTSAINTIRSGGAEGDRESPKPRLARA
jgi:ATP-dependent helicase/nuclease subunit A